MTKQDHCVSVLNTISESLRTDGFVILDNVLPIGLASALCQRIHEHKAAGELRAAGIGRREQHAVERSIRQDSIHWLNADHTAESGWLIAMEKLRMQANRELLLGLFEYESHFAHYPPGAGYKKHYDAFRGQSNRVLSTVYYLNQDWREGNGGELMIYDHEDTPLIRVAPLFNRMVVFLSEEFPHEVLPASTDRYSIAGWFRVNAPQDLLSIPAI